MEENIPIPQKEKSTNKIVWVIIILIVLFGILILLALNFRKFIEKPVEVIDCNDSDGGIDLERKGKVTEIRGKFIRIYEDECVSETKLNEMICAEFGWNIVSSNCSPYHICENGACIQKINILPFSNDCGNINKPNVNYLNSNFLKEDATALKIFSGDISNYKITKIKMPTGKADVNSFAYRFMNGIVQLGYSFSVLENGESWVNKILSNYNKFQMDNGLSKTDTIDKKTLGTLDKLLFIIEQNDACEVSKLKEYIKLNFNNSPMDITFSFSGNPNQPNPEHYVALISKSFLKLPDNLHKWTQDGNEFIAAITAEETTPIYLQPPFILYSEIRSIETSLHEYAHLIDREYLRSSELYKDLSEEFPSTDKKDPSLDFYKIGWKNFSTYKDEEGFVSAYAKNNPYEDFAETFVMYFDEGRIFRDLISESGNQILQAKYTWMKDNLFDGIEYDTGNKNFMNYIEDIQRIKEVIGNPIEYSVYDPNYPYDVLTCKNYKICNSDYVSE